MTSSALKWQGSLWVNCFCLQFLPATPPPPSIEEISAQSCFSVPFLFFQIYSFINGSNKTKFDNVKIYITQISHALALVASSPMMNVQEAEEKRKRLEEAEKKRQAMMQEWGSCVNPDMMQESYLGHACFMPVS
jgi:hypothetical protein